MNYLAHAYLSGDNEGLIIGNFIGDNVRGNQYLNFPADIQKGVILHREIDQFTDSHPLFRESKRFFYENFEKHSGILVDIYFDHLLASEFQKHTGKELTGFTAEIYKIYQENVNLLPENNKRFLNYVLINNIYVAYSEISGIETVLYHLSKRINHDVLLDKSLSDFLHNREKLSENFGEFFEEIKTRFHN